MEENDKPAPGTACPTSSIDPLHTGVSKDINKPSDQDNKEQERENADTQEDALGKNPLIFVPVSRDSFSTSAWLWARWFPSS